MIKNKLGQRLFISLIVMIGILLGLNSAMDNNLPKKTEIQETDWLKATLI